VGATILVADDNQQIADLLAERLAMSGHKISLVHDGVELVRRAAEIRPHLIITDVQMPGGFGSTAFLELQKDEKTKGIPVIFISAHPIADFMPDSPSVRYVPKPIDFKKLSEVVVELLPLGGYSAPRR
jgi:CheY-like chemotaxis protein